MRLVFVRYLCIASSFLALPAHAETIENAVQSALKEYPSVAAAKAALTIANEQRREEFSNYFPMLSVGATGGRIFGDNATSRGLNTTRGQAYSWLWEGTVSARQRLFDGFETSNRVDSAEAKKQSAEMSLADVRESLCFSTAQAYIDLLRSRKALLMMEDQASKANDYLGRIQGALNEGASDEAEYQQAQNVKAELDGLVAEYQGQEAAAETQYIQLTGALPQDEIQNPSPATQMVFEDVEEAVLFAKENHPSVKAAKLMVQSAKHDVGAELSSLYPDLNGELSYLQSDKKEEIGGEVEDGRAVLRMNWDLETGGGQFARIRRTKGAVREAQARLAEIERQVERGVRLAYAEYDTSMNVLSNQTMRVQLSQNLMNTLDVQFEGARVRLLQLMQSDNQNFTARLEQMNGIHRALLAQYAVLASTGQLQSSMNLSTQ